MRKRRNRDGTRSLANSAGLVPAYCAGCGVLTGERSPNRPPDAPPIRCRACTSKIIAKRLTENYGGEA